MAKGSLSRALAVFLALASASPAWAAKAKPPVRKVANRAAAPASAARPDRALFEEAVAARVALRNSPRKLSRVADWEAVILRYRRVLARYPQSAYCDDALLGIGDLYRQMALRFAPVYADDAVQAYRALVSEYPSSRHGDDALFHVFEIAQASSDRRRMADAGRRYLEAFPGSPRAAEVRAQLRQRAPAQSVSLPKAPPTGLARVFNVRFWSGDSSTRVVLDVEKQVALRYDRVQHPDRLWVDLVGTRLHPNLTDRSFPVGDGLLQQIRVGQNRDDVVRIVLDFKEVRDHSVFYLDNPTRVVIDVRGQARPKMASATATEPAAPDAVPPAATEPAEQRLPARRVPAGHASRRASGPRASNSPADRDRRRRAGAVPTRASSLARTRRRRSRPRPTAPAATAWPASSAWARAPSSSTRAMAATIPGRSDRTGSRRRTSSWTSRCAWRRWSARAWGPR